MHGLRWVPHRTLTHWWAVWALLIFVAYLKLDPLIAGPVIAFAVGAILHITGDIITPMGVPGLWPAGRVSVFAGQPNWLLATGWLITVAGVSVGLYILMMHEGWGYGS